MLSKSFFLSALHLVVVVDVAALALALGVEGAIASVSTVSGEGASPILVVAVIAHAMGVEG